MNTIVVRHYVPAPSAKGACPHCVETGGNIRSVIDEIAPRLSGMNLDVRLETVPVRQTTDNKTGSFNTVSFLAPDAGIPDEVTIEELLDAEVRTEGGARTLVLNGVEYGALPKELITDAIVRVVFATMGGCGGGGCGTCTGCPE